MRLNLKAGLGRREVLRAGRVARVCVVTERLESRRLLSAGQLDPSFGTNGFSVSELFPGGYPAAGATQTDGKILVGGSGFDLARFNTDGSVDRTFGAAQGRTVMNASNAAIFAITVLKDGKILAAGTKDNDFAIARFLPSGQLDSTFGSNGIELLSFSGDAIVNAMAIQPDGKIDVAGGAYNTIGQDRIALARFTPSGQLDQTFGTHGVVATVLPGGASAADLALQPNGDLLIAGGSNIDDPFSGDFLLARYTSTGTLDSTFAKHGLDVVTALGTGAFSSLALKSNGQIIAGGNTAEGTTEIARFQSNGTFDTSFGNHGIATPSVGDEDQFQFSKLFVQKSGDIVAVGTDLITVRFDGAFPLLALARFGPNGSVDTHFGNDGISDGIVNATANGAVMQANESIIVFGHAAIGDQGGDFALTRFALNGTVDGHFGIAGVVEQPNGLSSYNVTGLQSGGKIIAGGDVFELPALARFNPDGTLDPTFGNGGRVLLSNLQQFEIRSLSIDVNGNITIALGNGLEGRIMRFHADGSPDLSFGKNGIVSTPFDPHMTVEANGQIVAAGATIGTDIRQVLADRFLPNGAPDPSFGTGGQTLVSSALAYPAVNAVAVAPNGKIVIAGQFNNDFGIIRLLASGKLDSGFGAGGFVISDFSGQDLGGVASAILIDAAGNILVGGGADFASDDAFASSATFFTVARYTAASGKLDTTFGNKGVVTFPLQGNLGDQITSLALEKDGKIVAGGSTTSGGLMPPFFDSESAAVVLRFTAKGAVDTTFGQKGIVLPAGLNEEGVATNVMELPDGEILGAATDLFVLKTV